MGQPIITIDQGPEFCVTKDLQKIWITIRKSESEPIKCLIKTDSTEAIEFEHYLPLHQEVILFDQQTNIGIELIQNESVEDFVFFRVSVYLI